MLRWERVPILGNNPVFCFEARRVWTRRTILLLIVVAVGLALVSWVAHPNLFARLSRWPKGPARWIALRGSLWVLPPSLSTFRGLVTEGVPSEYWGPYWAAVSYLLMKAVQWGVAVGSQYFVPVLTALSLVDDRAGGRLGPLLVSRMSRRAILVGKLMAAVLPLCLGLIGTAAVFGSLAVLGGTIGWLFVLWHSLSVLFGLFAHGMIGLRVGASARGRERAVAVSLLVALVGLPLAQTSAWYATVWALWRAVPSAETSPGWFWAVQIGSDLPWQGLLFAGLWFSTKRALAGAAQ